MRYLLLLLSLPLFAAEIKELGVTQRFVITSQEETQAFKVLDYLCVMSDDTEVACGFVVKASAKDALIDLEIRSQKLEVGMKVRPARKHLPCNADTIYTPRTDKRKEPELTDLYHRGCTEEEMKSSTDFHLPAKYYFAMGLSLLSPRLEGEFAINPHWSLGASLDLATFKKGFASIKASSDGTAYGGHALLTYHFDSDFRGFYGQYGIGYMKGRLKLRGHLDDWSGLSMVALVGYHLLGWHGFGIGAYIGGYYLQMSFDKNPTPTSFLSPFIGGEFGIAF